MKRGKAKTISEAASEYLYLDKEDPSSWPQSTLYDIARRAGWLRAAFVAGWRAARRQEKKGGRK